MDIWRGLGTVRRVCANELSGLPAARPHVFFVDVAPWQGRPVAGVYRASDTLPEGAVQLPYRMGEQLPEGVARCTACSQAYLLQYLAAEDGLCPGCEQRMLAAYAPRGWTRRERAWRWLLQHLGLQYSTRVVNMRLDPTVQAQLQATYSLAGFKVQLLLWEFQNVIVWQVWLLQRPPALRRLLGWLQPGPKLDRRAYWNETLAARVGMALLETAAHQADDADRACAAAWDYPGDVDSWD